MFREEENQVALFIDWDNLAISTAADFGGASPDVRAIVRVAQRYGTVLLARAYAEWQVPSDRLAVYRAGVDPIYAPTFRFEPDIAGQPPRGKSLADPCLVADCIDTLHLMPAINYFILVSGDKDLIPIVRLVQLRGKKVVVIGPDYVAAILREMADEYISYRSIVDSGEAVTAVPDQFAAGTAARRRRAMQGRTAPTATLPVAPAAPAPIPTPAPAAPIAPVAPVAQPPIERVRPSRERFERTERVERVERVEPTEPVERVEPVERIERPERIERGERGERPQRAERGRPARIVEAPPVAPPAPAAPEVAVPTRREVAPTAEAPVEAPPAVEDIGSLMTTITQILTEREKQGRGRLRATNLKDLLMARMRGFNERRFGFAKFRDLLTAAERAGVLEISQIGQVQWVALPKGGGAPAEASPAASPAPQTAEAAPTEISPSDVELVRFIVDLRGRSRWLTYTYVLTNLISHQAQRGEPRTAEVDARAALDRLVAQGVIRVDLEPREIEVGGARHRVRMCHIEETHPLVASLIAERGQGVEEAEEAETAEAPAAPVAETPAAPAPAAEPAAPVEPVAQPTVAPTASPAFGLAPLPASLLMPTSGVSEARPAVEAPVAPAAPAPAAEAPVAPPAPEVSAATEQPEAATPVAAAEPTSEEAAPAQVAEAVTAPAEAAPAEAAPSIADVFSVLREVVRDAVTPERPVLGAAGVKTRLTKRFGAFDERAYGFGKFKDFLLAAQREGYIRVEVSGPATRVGLPSEG